MLTIFSIPKSFTGKSRGLQRNAVASWKRVSPDCEVVLFGDDDQVRETAAELGVTHVPSIQKNEHGTPLLSSAFSTIQKIARHDLIMYVNADIILFQDVIGAVRRVTVPEFLLCGRRWDLDVAEELDFNDPEWSTRLMERIHAQGSLHGPAGIDYFIFPRGLITMPEFSVGRPGWDSWLIYALRMRNVPVIDSTAAITIVHQNHDYSHSKFGEKKRVGGPEMRRNIELAGGLSNLLTLRDADFLLVPEGIVRPRFARRIYSLLSTWYAWRLLLACKRAVMQRLTG